MHPRFLLSLIFLCVVCAGVYAPMLDGESLDWDDTIWLGDPLLSLPLVDAVRQAFTTSLQGAWYPLLRLSWWIQLSLFGPDPTLMHTVHLGLFLTSVAGLATMFTRAGLHPPTAFVATALWALHPTRVESVAWLTSRKDLLSLVLILGAAHLVLSRRPRVALLVFALACLTKAAVFPLAVLFAWRMWRSARPEAAGFLAVAAIVALIGRAVFIPAPTGYPYPTTLENAGFAFGLQGTWIRRLIDPTQLAAIQPLPASPWPWVVGATLCLGGAALLASRHPRGPFLLAWWLLPLVPTHGLVAMAFWGADRHLLYPSMAVALALAWGAHRLLHWAAPLALLPLLAWGSHHRIDDWHDSLTLWTVEAARPGHHWARQLMVGTALGRAARFDEAVDAYRLGEALKPGDSVLIARRMLAELAADGWDERDAAIARGLQPPPRTAGDWASLAQTLQRIDHPLTCDAAAQAARLGSPTSICR